MFGPGAFQTADCRKTWSSLSRVSGGKGRGNPLGLHRVTLREIVNNRLRIGPVEAIDGTPVVDIKPVLCDVGDF
jgi:hypothetical protein